MSYAALPSSTKKLALFRLADASQHSRWRSTLQDYMFARIRNTDMDLLTQADTLDEKYFMKEYKQEHAAASKDALNAKVDPMTDATFIKLCTDHAFRTGEGFHDWLYGMYADVRAALSDKIQDQTAGVTRGDLVGLLKAVSSQLPTTSSSNRTPSTSSSPGVPWMAKGRTIS